MKHSFGVFCLLLVLTDIGATSVHAMDVLAPGTYTLDPHHTSVIFKINHLGFSYFTGRFNHVEGEYNFDPQTPEQSNLDVTLYPGSIDTNNDDLDDALRGTTWFDTLKYPRATFHSTQIEITGEKTAKITGDFTLHNVTHSLVLDTVLVGAGTIPFTGTQVMGFSATGRFNRADYGISNLEPMIGDEITLQIDSEFDKEM